MKNPVGIAVAVLVVAILGSLLLHVILTHAAGSTTTVFVFVGGGVSAILVVIGLISYMLSSRQDKK